MDHQGLGSEAHGWISSLVSRVLPGLPDLEHRRAVTEFAETIVPLVVAAHQREIALLRRHLESRWEEERRQEDRLLTLRNALRFFEETEPDGWRATQALRDARWRSPWRVDRDDPADAARTPASTPAPPAAVPAALPPFRRGSRSAPSRGAGTPFRGPGASSRGPSGSSRGPSALGPADPSGGFRPSGGPGPSGGSGPSRLRPVPPPG